MYDYQMQQKADRILVRGGPDAILGFGR
jgi:hypothetical protein